MSWLRNLLRRSPFSRQSPRAARIPPRAASPSPASTRQSRVAAPSAERQVRVFLSSTFGDMQADRDHLVKFVFPQLRRLCETCGVTWGEVDLRWGISDEQKAEGRVLPICLEEIRRCRPYFIGLLGQRYGWIPEGIPAELLEKEPWLREQVALQASVTELEILHGVLRAPAEAGHAYFYLRDPKYAAAQPQHQRVSFTCESSEGAEKLSRLKQRIRGSGLPVRENYASPEELGALVLADLTAAIESDFPKGSAPGPLVREALDHAAYARSRQRSYVPRPEYLARLDAHADGDGRAPLVVTGESGSGKSALLAHWVGRYRERHPTALVIEHYIGASPASADWTAMLRRILGELKQTFGLDADIPARPAGLRSAFPDWLHMAAAATQGRADRERRIAPHLPRPGKASRSRQPAASKIVLVIDALDQLEDRDGARDLIWLPRLMPENVRLIVSALPGRTLDGTTRRGWPVLTVELLSSEERRAVVHRFLEEYGRNLSAARVDRIVEAPQAANPLFLTVLLDELRQWGLHERLGERIEHYLSATDPCQLYGLVLQRWEEDYAGAEQLVRKGLGLIWAARRGLSEIELLDLLGTAAGPLPRAHWAPLFFALENNLTQRVGLLSLGHAYLAEAVRLRYFKSAEDEAAAHRQLAEYFSAGRGGKWDDERDSVPHAGDPAERWQRHSRRLVELPWQLAKASEWDRLAAFLTSPRWFELLFQHELEPDLHQYWRQLVDRVPMCAAYDAAVIRFAATKPSADALAFFVHQVARFLASESQFAAAEQHYRHALQLAMSTGVTDTPTTLAIQSNLAETLVSLGRSREAEQIYSEVGRAGRRVGFDPLLRSIQLSNLGNSLRAQGRLREAIKLLQQAIALVERGPSATSTLATNLINLAAVQHEQGDDAAAIKSSRRALEICERHLGGGHLLTGRCLAGLALICHQQERNDEAEPYYRRAIEICEESGAENDEALGQTYYNLAWLLVMTGREAEATDMARRSAQVFRKAASDAGPERGAVFELLGALLIKSGHLDEAEAYARQSFAEAANERRGWSRLARDAMTLMRICAAHGNLAFAGRIRELAIDSLDRVADRTSAPQRAELLEALAKISFATNEE